MRKTLRHSWLLLTAFALAACGDIAVDDFRSEGGASPDPTGVIQGTILYSGPRPVCEYDEVTGDPTRVLGRVVLTLFVFDNPPPPSGSATGAENLLTVPGQLLFTTLNDCLPQDATPEQRAEFIVRSVDFTWPEIPLGDGGPLGYQIRGFYDYDEDFIPFFGITRLGTAGDIAGGAFVDPNAAVREFREIRFGAAQDRPNGEVIGGISVALGAPINTELPAFRLTGDPLNAEEVLPTSDDPIVRENDLYDNTNTRLEMFSRNPDDEQTAALMSAMDVGGLALNTADEFAYAWYVRPVNVDDNPEEQDLHPILGSANIPWYFPIVLQQRVQNEIEVAAGVPSVLLVPTVRPTQVLNKEVFYPNIDIAIAPVGAVSTAADDRCTFPYIPPGNTTANYERIPVDCQEVPAGFYATNVLQGLAGALPAGGGLRECDAGAPGIGEPCVSDAQCVDDGLVCNSSGECAACRTGAACQDGRCQVLNLISDTQRNLIGGQYSSQSWAVPNALGDPSQVGEDAAVASQGPEGLYVVYDPNPEGPVGRQGGRAGCDRAVDPEDGMEREIVYQTFETAYGDAAAEVEEICCGPIEHLCGLPLCEAIDAGGGLMLRSSPTSSETDDQGRVIPNCVPFEMPALCCGAAG